MVHDAEPGTHRPRGLRFVSDVVNGPATQAGWAAATAAHGGSALGNRTVDPDRLASAITDLREVFGTDDVAVAATRLNALLAEPPLPVALVRVDDARWALRPGLPDDADAAAALAAIGAFALAEWLSDRGRCAWGSCAARGCERVFVDEGRRQPQRFCSERCATRTRVAMHRARAASTGESEDPEHP